MATIKRAPTGHRCGESHPRAKLKDDIVRFMRETYAQWVKNGEAGKPGCPKGYGTMAMLVGCSDGTARDIITYRTRINA